MVKRDELPQTSEATKVMALRISDALKAAGVSQSQMSREMGRAQSYWSLRWNGLEPWNLDELDEIARRYLGQPDAMALIAHLRPRP